MSESRKVPTGPQRPKDIHAGSPSQSKERSIPTGPCRPTPPATPAQAAKVSAKGDKAAAKIPSPTTIKPVGK